MPFLEVYAAFSSLAGTVLFAGIGIVIVVKAARKAREVYNVYQHVRDQYDGDDDA